MTTTQTIKKFLEPAMQCPRSVINMLALDLTLSAQMIALIYCTQYAVAGLEQNNPTTFLFWIYIMAAVSIVSLITKILWKPRAFTIFRDLWTAIDRIYIPQIIYGDNNTFEGLGTGKLIDIYKKGMDRRVDLCLSMTSEFLTTLLLFGSLLYTVGTKDMRLFRAIIIVLLIIGIRFYAFVHLPNQYRATSKTIETEMSRRQVRWLMSKYEIMQSNKLESEFSRREKINQKRYENKEIEKTYQGISFDVPMFFASILFVGLVRYIGQQVMQGVMTYADVVGIVGIGSIFIKDLDVLITRSRVMIDKWIDITRFWDLIDDLQKNHRDITVGKEFVPTTSTIKLHHIDYGYTSTTKIFDTFNLTIQGGKKTALVGPSGGGKTTLMKLIAGYIEPDGGSIDVDGQSIAPLLERGVGGDQDGPSPTLPAREGVALQSYYRHIGYLTQDPSVFDGTIRENLLYGLPSPTPPSEGGNFQSQLDNIISAACCQFIYDMPNGLDTEIGERGIRLSGGQKQRLAIAKIMLKNPSIILLDEPTSALDSHNEQQVTLALNNLFAGKTVIVIAHRLQTVKHADEIIYIADGKILERGTHTELLALGGEYATMVELQSGF